MCNAHRHGAGCSCGFGPPYLNSMYPGATREWAEDILEEPALARKGLEELGWTERSIEEFLAEYSQLLNTGLPDPSMVLRIKQMLGRHRTVEREVFREVLRVPLFRFSAPRARGAKVQYSESYAEGREGVWDARVYGLGTAGSKAFRYHTEHEYTATNGQCKLIFVPVRLRVARVDVYEGGAKTGEGIRAQVALPKAKKECWVSGRGVRALKRADCAAPIDGLPDEVFDYPLAGDRGDPTRVRRRWAVDVRREVFIGLTKVFGGEVRAVVRRDRDIAVALTLPAGRDYEGAKGPGALWWTAP